MIAESTNNTGTIHYSVLRSSQDFYKIREDWSELLLHANEDNIFLTWEWLYNWWEVYQENRNLFILIAQHSGNLVGIFPLVQRQVTYYGFITLSRIEFLSTGELEHEETCPFSMGLIVHHKFNITVYKGFMEFLVNDLKDEWDELVLMPILKCLESTQIILSNFKLKKRYFFKEIPLWNNLSSELPADWESLLNTFGSKTRRNIRKARRVLFNLSDFSYNFLENSQELPDYFHKFVKLHEFRWGNQGAFSSDKFLSFHKKVCNEFFQKGWLRISLMFIDGEVVGGNIDYQFRDRYFAYQTAFNPNFTHLSVGLAGFTFCLEDAIRHQCRVFDWYRATGKSDYKNHFKPMSQEVISLQYRKKNVRSWAISVVQKFETIMRYGVKIALTKHH